MVGTKLSGVRWFAKVISERRPKMNKPTPHSTYQILEDAMMLAGSFAQLGKTLAAHKIQSSAESANAYIHSKVDLTDLDTKLADAAEGLGSASDYALHTDLKHMVDDAGVFARKHPVAALISVVAVGAMVGRLLLRHEPPVAKTPAKAAPLKPVRPPAKTRGKANGTKQTHA